jgi:hypothetical protein
MPRPRITYQTEAGPYITANHAQVLTGMAPSTLKGLALTGRLRFIQSAEPRLLYHEADVRKLIGRRPRDLQPVPGTRR